jgi:hypothetical protein
LKQLGRVTAALLLVILILGGVIAYAAVSYQDEASSQSLIIQGQSSTIQSQSSALQSQSSALSKSQSAVTKLETNATATEKLLNQDKAQLANLTATVSADQSEIATIEVGYSQANSTIATLNTSVVPLQTEVASLKNQVSGLNAQVATLQSQLTSDKSQLAQLTSIVALSESSIKISGQFVSIPAISNQVAASFEANYSGYVMVSMSSISEIGEIQVGVILLFGPSVISGQYPSEPVGPYSYTTIPDSLVFPVTPGDITVYLANSAPTTQNTTVSVTYYY